MTLDAPRCQVESAGRSVDGGSTSYTSGAARLEISWRPESLYDDYVRDRRSIVRPPAPGTPIQVLGRQGQLWSYAGIDDHTVIREPEAGYSFEIHGQGLSVADFRDLLGRLRLVDPGGYEAALPPRFVTTSERDTVVEEMIGAIADALGSKRGLSPTGIPAAAFDSLSPGRYDLGAHVAGVVACSWLASYVEGRAAGDDEQVADAVAALATSRRWPVLLDMDTAGDFSEVVWLYADDVAAARDVDRYGGGLGC